MADDPLIEERVRALTEVVIAIAGGDLAARASASDRDDEVAALAIAVNMLAEELQIQTRRRAEAERQLAEKIAEVERANDELRRSNEDLEHFAYVASHDLQEPLRMVASYTQLLDRRYRGRLDADADDFIGYAVDGARRMQALIHSLLEFSRVGRVQRPREPVALDACVEAAMRNLAVAIAESGATIDRAKLPAVTGDRVQRVQLFQNVLSNAIKFRGEARPRIRVAAAPGEGEWVIAVEDNGVGFDPAFASRLFQVFQRLHGREFPGTGIGLAMCRKIVERHGERIEITSRPGAGTTVQFTLPRA